MYILLFLLWIALNGRITAEIVAFGVVIAAAVYWFMCRFLEYSLKSDIRFFKNFFRILQYMFVLLVEIVKSSFAVIKIVFSKNLFISFC